MPRNKDDWKWDPVNEEKAQKREEQTEVLLLCLFLACFFVPILIGAYLMNNTSYYNLGGALVNIPAGLFLLCILIALFEGVGGKWK